MHITRRDTIVLLSAAASALALERGRVMRAEGDTHDVREAAGVAATNGVPDHVLGVRDGAGHGDRVRLADLPALRGVLQQRLPGVQGGIYRHRQGEVHLRPFVRNVLDAVVFMLAEAGGPENYHNILETFSAPRTTWAVAEKPRDALLAVAKQLGFTDETFDAALTNQALFNGDGSDARPGARRFKLEGTPTFYVNGKQLTGRQDA